MNIEPTPALKFEDCKLCRFRRKPSNCVDCDSGELFEERGRAPLDFSDNRRYRVVTEETETFVPSQSVIRHIDDLFSSTPEYEEEQND